VTLKPKKEEKAGLGYFQDSGVDRKAYALILAAYNDNTETAEKIIATDPDQINSQDPYARLTALHIAIFRQNERLVALLAGHPQTDLRLKDGFGRRPVDCNRADDMLFSLGQPGVVDSACATSHLGKLTPNALYIHESALGALSPALRAFEGCARCYLGQVEGANIIKLHRAEPKISYLSYPAFEDDPHPALASSLTVDLQTFKVKFHGFQSRLNPPILHRKELFLAPDHPLHAKFSRLTRIEENKGLFEDASRIGLRDGWNELLAAKGLSLKGHRLISRR
jgi:DNA phosphorothioation-associated putative methyltransferase